MKKMIKKIAAAFMAMALVAVGMLAVNKAEVKAAYDPIYVTGDFNSWNWDNCGTLTSEDGTNYSGNIDVSGDGAIVLNRTKDWSGGDGGKYTYNFGGGSGIQLTVTFPNPGTYKLEYSTSTQNLTVTPVSVVTVNWTYEYYIAGPATLGANDWAGNAVASAGKMTESAGKYVLTTTATGAGSEYCVVKYGIPDDDSVENTTNWLKDPSTQQNFAIGDTVVEGATLVFTFNPTDGTCTVVVTPPAADDDDDTTNPSSPAGDNDDDTTNPSSPAGDNDDDTTNPSSPAGDNDDDTTTPSSPAGDSDDDTTTPSSPAGDNDDDTTTPSSPAGDNDDDTTTPSSPAGDKDDESAGDGEEGGSSAEDTPAGDNSMVAIYAILAVLAAGVVTVAVAKRRAIEE